MKQNQELNSNSYTLGKASRIWVDDSQKPSLSPERHEIISKLIQKYSPVLGGSSFDEQIKRKQKHKIYLPQINARSLAQKKQNYSYLDYSKVKW